MQLRFLHCADLHLGAAFVTTDVPTDHEANPETVDEKLLQSLVETAIQHDAAGVFFAGDVFDGPAPTLLVQRRFQDALTKLDRQGISSFIIEGNHDAGVWSNFVFALPPTVTVFSPQCRQRQLQLGDETVEIWGFGFEPDSRNQTPVEKFPATITSAWSAVLLHVENREQGQYHPTPHRRLQGSPFSYHALGHEHSFSQQKQPLAVYPGAAVGRSPAETGVKGVCLVNAVERDTTVRFLSAAPLQREAITVDLTGRSVEQVWEFALQKALDLRGNDHLPLVCSLNLTGFSSNHKRWVDHEYRTEFLESLRSEADPGKNVWWDRLNYEGWPEDMMETAAKQDEFFAQIVQELADLPVPDAASALQSQLGAGLSLTQAREQAQRLAAAWLLENDERRRPDVDPRNSN